MEPGVFASNRRNMSGVAGRGSEAPSATPVQPRRRRRRKDSRGARRERRNAAAADCPQSAASSRSIAYSAASRTEATGSLIASCASGKFASGAAM